MGLRRLVRLGRLVDYGSRVVRIGVRVVRVLGVHGVGARVVALVDLELLGGIPRLLLLVLWVGACGRTMLRGIGGLLVVVGLVVFGLVLAARLGHGRRRLLGGRGIIIRARHSGERRFGEAGGKLGSG
jgi:hypothetical protein